MTGSAGIDIMEISNQTEMKMLTLVLWILLAVLSLPLAILALVLWPIVWLISLPLRLVGITLKGVFDLIGAIVGLPARLLRGPKG
jgi:hypothetical protein